MIYFIFLFPDRFLGFDRDSIVNDKIIKNIDESSNAYKAGLREGDRIIEYDAPKGRNPDQVVVFKTKEKSIHFRPEGNEKYKVWQIKKSLTEADKEKVKRFFQR